MNKTFSLLFILLLSGCSSVPIPPAKDLAPETPATWRQKILTGKTVVAQQHWWHAFHDSTLNRLIESVLQKNNDLAIATLKVHQALYAAGLTNTNQTPDVSASISGVRQRSWDQSNNNSNPNPATQNQPQPTAQYTYSTMYSSTLSLTYDIDLWGKLRDQRLASRLEAAATEEDRAATALALIGTTAKLYWTGVYLNQLVRINRASLAYSEKSLSIASAKYTTGHGDKLDVLQEEQNVASQKAALEVLYQQQEANQYSLAILLDQPPEMPIFLPKQFDTHPLPDIPAGVPADVLSRRPDVKAAELRLREEFSSLKATEKSFYPTFSLTGAMSTSSNALKRVLRDPTESIGAGITFPFLEWGTRNLTIKQEQMIYEQAVRTFRQTFYTALSDVETNLSARQHYLKEGELYQVVLDKAKKAETIYETRYNAGDVEMLNWLEQQESRREAEKAVLENRLNQLTAQLALYQALGGDPVPQS